MYAHIISDDATNDVYTTHIDSTPELSHIYEKAYDGIVPHEGISGPKDIGTIPCDEEEVRKNVQDPTRSQEAMASAWGFNFNDSPYEKNRNLYHVIYTGEQNDHLYEDLTDPAVLGWATHVKCKGGGLSKCSGNIHTHELVAAVTNFDNRKVYDRDYKRITWQAYNLLPGRCDCAIQLDRDKCIKMWATWNQSQPYHRLGLLR